MGEAEGNVTLPRHNHVLSDGARAQVFLGLLSHCQGASVVEKSHHHGDLGLFSAAHVEQRSLDVALGVAGVSEPVIRVFLESV